MKTNEERYPIVVMLDRVIPYKRILSIPECTAYLDIPVFEFQERSKKIDIFLDLIKSRKMDCYKFIYVHTNMELLKSLKENNIPLVYFKEDDSFSNNDFFVHLIFRKNVPIITMPKNTSIYKILLHEPTYNYLLSKVQDMNNYLVPAHYQED